MSSLTSDGFAFSNLNAKKRTKRGCKCIPVADQVRHIATRRADAGATFDILILLLQDHCLSYCYAGGVCRGRSSGNHLEAITPRGSPSPTMEQRSCLSMYYV